MSEQKKKNEHKILIVSIIIIFACFFLILFFNQYFKEKKIDETTYNNFEFFYSEVEGLWYTQIQIDQQPFNIPFYYHPNELEDIIVQEGIEDAIWNKPSQIFITFPVNVTPKMGIAGTEISRLTGDRYGLFNIPTKSSLTEKTDISIGVTCQWANENTVVIYMLIGEQNIAFLNDDCIVLMAQNENESIRVADAFTYHLLKII